MQENETSSSDRSRIEDHPRAKIKRPPASIILFSDGTGNSSAKLFKTNVWRMYEALDLGPNEAGEPLQMAYYDNGVGTSTFRPFALLGGIFGFGLKGGVLRLYRYLCRNYQPGDRIYAFGFSRGAFTIRLLVALICMQGIVRGKGEGDLALQARAAYRELCREAWPNKWMARLVARSVRGVRDGLVYVKRRALGQRLYGEVEHHHPLIEFIGVWDTVAAYGGPFAEITRGIDDLIWPLTMPNYGLSVKVKRASHALALDDERDAFMPLLWDEVRERELVEGGRKVQVGDAGATVEQILRPRAGRLNQVWFTGMHSDVGGGYPDESLSYVAFLWMVDEVNRGQPAPMQLRFLDSYIARARDLSNAYGPVHDSRAGIQAYYRYQPRRIDAWLEAAGEETMSLRDPEIAGRDEKRKRCPDRGLLTGVKVHESVIARIVSGTDCYAPVALPGTFEVERSGAGLAPSYIEDTALEGFLGSAGAGPRAGALEAMWDGVWVRRKIYFATVFFTLVLIGSPWWLGWFGSGPIEDMCSDDRCLAARPIRWAGQFIPFAGPWTKSFAEHPLTFLILAAAVGVLLWRGKALGAQVHATSRRLWDEVTGTPSTDPLPSANGLARFRSSGPYQRFLRWLRWHFLPFVAGSVLWIAIHYTLLALVTQTYLLFAEPRVEGCTASVPHPKFGGILLTTNALCVPLQVETEAGRSYRLWLRVDQNWKDRGPWDLGGYRSAPDRNPAGMPWFVDKAGQPFRRAMAARWMEPLIRIRWDGWLLDRVFVSRLDLKPVPGKPGHFTADFKAQRRGALDIFVNDARLPFDGGAFYDSNEGSAAISVCRLPDPVLGPGDCAAPISRRLSLTAAHSG